MYDVIFKNGNVVDVKNEQILQADIAVKDGKIAGIGHFSGENVIDCTGKYITPGFIDAHVHIESSMATPMEFSKAVMPHGTTTVIADPHELVNVKGNEAMEYILDAAGDVTIEKTVDTSAYEEAVRDSVNADGEQESVKVSDLISGIGDAATVTDNGDGTTTIVYTGYYKENNITLGDLQKSTINILNLVMQSNQFADLFDDVESQPYTEAHSDNLVTYVTNEKGDVE